LFGLFVIIFFLIIILSEKISLTNIELNVSETKLPSVDITEPKFAINNEKASIYISAKEGNFLNNNEILLNKNVRFKSDRFIIETDEVIFNRSKLTAKSNKKSLFKSKNTTISSDGFNIYDKGNKIVFYGNSSIFLK
tara:strand:+ start:1069 stop:1479 length:411 start_codon:yes stop_codon:yes gene_type:complete